MSKDESCRFYVILGIVFILAVLYLSPCHATDYDASAKSSISISFFQGSFFHGGSVSPREQLILLSDDSCNHFWSLEGDYCYCMNCGSEYSSDIDNCNHVWEIIDGEGYCMTCSLDYGFYVRYSSNHNDNQGIEYCPNSDNHEHDWTVIDGEGFCNFCGMNFVDYLNSGGTYGTYNPSPSPSEIPEPSVSPEPSEDPIEVDGFLFTDAQYKAAILGILIFFVCVILFYGSYKFLRIFF